jgi:nucleotide-binding universal stress UspA family protein
MYKKIVVGYDGSDRALRAVEEAADLATATGAVLHLITAVQKQNQIHEFGESSDKMFLSETQLANEQLLNLAAKLKHLDVRVGAVRGAPAQVLLDEARRVDADLILVGNRNVQGLSRILGSVAEDVAHKAPCAVLIAKTA